MATSRRRRARRALRIGSALGIAAVLLVCGSTGLGAQQRELAPDERALIEALRDGDVVQLRALAAGGMDLSRPFEGNATPLLLALVSGRVHVVETILDLIEEVPPEYLDPRMAPVVRSFENGEAMLDLLIEAGARTALPEEDGTEVPPEDLPRIDAPGSYPAQRYSGACSSEWVHTRPDQRPGDRERMMATRTLFYTEGSAPDVPLQGTVRFEGGATLSDIVLAPLPAGPARGAVTPDRGCAPVTLGPGKYTVIVETSSTESIWECSPRAGPACGWWILSSEVYTVERRRIDGVVIGAEAEPAEPEEPESPTVVIQGPARTTEGLDSEPFTVVSMPAGQVQSYRWVAEVPEGVGNAPESVGFEAPGERSTRILGAHWFASPDSEWARDTGITATYTVRAFVTIDGEEHASQPLAWTVEVLYEGRVRPVANWYRGTPTIARSEADGLYRIVDQGDFRRLRRDEFEIIIDMPPTSQFYARLRAHERHHVEQVMTIPPWSTLWDADAFYRDTLSQLPGRPSREEMEELMGEQIAAWARRDEDRFLAAACDQEAEAHRVEWEIPPRYLNVRREDLGFFRGLSCG